MKLKLGKYALLGVVLMASQTTLTAQIGKGSIEAGMLGSYYQSDLLVTLGGGSVGGEQNLSRLDLQAGYFFSDVVAIGLRFRHDREYFKVNNQITNAITGSSEPYVQIESRNLYGLYGRYYFQVGQFVYFYGQAQLGTGSGLFSYTETDSVKGIIQSERELMLGDFGIGAGLSIFPVEVVALDLNIMRDIRTEAYDPQVSGVSGPQVETYEGFSVQIGIRLFIDPTQAFQRSFRKPIPTR